MRDGARTRARILDEALALFARKGVEGTSVRDIAQAVGVAEGALYRHFKAKEDIAREVFLTHFEALAADVALVAGGPDPFPRRVWRLVLHFATLFDERPALFTFILINQHRHLDAVPTEAARNPVSALRDLFRRAMESGDIDPGDADLAAALALGLVVQPAVFRLYGRIEGPMTRQAPAITRAVLAALGARPPV